MSLFKQFKTDRNSEQNGIEVRFQANDDGSIPTFRITRAGKNNPIWLKTFEAKTRPYSNDIKTKAIDEETAIRINIEVFCSAVLIGWSNVKNENGNNIDFNYKNAIDLMTELPELFEILNEKSLNFENFLQANLKDDEKN